MIDGMPLFMVPAGGNTGGDEPVDGLFSVSEEHAARTGMDGNRLKVMGDGGYGQSSTFGSVSMHTGSVPNCNVKEGAVIHEEADRHRVQEHIRRCTGRPGMTRTEGTTGDSYWDSCMLTERERRWESIRGTGGSNA